jgi:hypothetical protein
MPNISIASVLIAMGNIWDYQNMTGMIVVQLISFSKERQNASKSLLFVFRLVAFWTVQR